MSNNFLKTGFLLGLGAAVTSKEKVEKYIDELIVKGKVTPKEADELYDSLLKKGEEAEANWNARSKEKMSSIMEDLNIVSRDEFHELRNQVQYLEEKIKKLESDQNNASDDQ